MGYFYRSNDSICNLVCMDTVLLFRIRDCVHNCRYYRKWFSHMLDIRIIWNYDVLDNDNHSHT